MKDSTNNTAIAPDTGKKVRKKARDLTVEDFYFLKIGNMWRYMKTQHFSFWMICCYIFFEYTRPQAIFPAIDILPWAQMFILLSMVGAVLDPTVRWISSPMNWLLNIFAVLIFLSSVYAVYPEISKEHYIDFYSWFVVYYLIINIVNTRERFYIFMLIIMISSAKIAFGTTKTWAMRGFGFTSWGLKGPTGYFENSGELAILMLTLFPLAFFLYAKLKDRVEPLERYLLLMMWVSPILTILGASSRGAQLALVLQLVIIFHKKIFRLKQLVLITVLVSLFMVLLPEEQKQRFEVAGEDKTSTQRLLYWRHGLEIMRDYPILGVGFFNFPAFYDQYYSFDLLYPFAQLPHNIFIQVGTDTGYSGLAVFLLIILFVFISRRYDAEKEDAVLAVFIKGIKMGLLGYVVAGQFVSVAYYPFLWIGLALFVSARTIESRFANKSYCSLS